MEKQNDRLVLISCFFLVLQLILDFVGTRLLEATSFLAVAKGIKVLFLFFMVGVLLRRKVFQPLYVILFLALIALLSQFTLYGAWNDIPWVQIGREGMLFAGGIVIAFFFKSIQEQYTSGRHTFVLHFTLGVILLVCLSIFLGFVFDIQLFKTYRGGMRFGYTGILHKSIAATYFFIGSICLSYYYTYLQPRIKPWIFYTILCCSFLVGTKGIYLFNGFFFIYSFYVHQLYRNKLFYSGVLVVLFVGFLFKNALLTGLKSTHALFYSIYSKHGLLTSLMSFRNEIFIQKAAIYKERWQGLHYVIGGKLPEVGLFEMSLVDLYVYFGAIGMILVLVLYYKGVVVFPKKKQMKQYVLFCYLSILIISIFAGQLFVNFSSIFFVLWVLFLINNGEIVKKID